MGRPSKLSEKQWAEIERRLLDGEIPAALAKEFDVDRSAITRRFAQQLRNVKEVANQIVKTDAALKSLPLMQQVQAISLAETLRGISQHLGHAAHYGAMTSHRLMGIAHQQVQMLDDSEPMSEQSMEALKSVRALTLTANDAAAIGTDLLKANKEMINMPQTGVTIVASPLDERI